ncbi:phage head closure protein [Camelimonas abortus]|uniref:Phage head closure protein n=1 Tax=Camelimonas abortus TaxID=1017184 RepID=A0ABV7LF54_9HYPH
MASPTRVRDLRRRLVIERAVSAPDGAGGFTASWTEAGVAWAAMRLRRGAEAERAGRRGLDNVWAVVMRWRDDIDGQCRLRDGDRAFAILSRGDPDGRRRWLALTVREETP